MDSKLVQHLGNYCFDICNITIIYIHITPPPMNVPTPENLDNPIAESASMELSLIERMPTGVKSVIAAATLAVAS